MRPRPLSIKGAAAAIAACLFLTGCEDPNAQQQTAPQARGNQEEAATSTPTTQQEPEPRAYAVQQPAQAVPDSPGLHRRMEPHFEESELPQTPRISGKEVPMPQNFPVPVAAVEQPQDTAPEPATQQEPASPQQPERPVAPDPVQQGPAVEQPSAVEPNVVEPQQQPPNQPSVPEPSVPEPNQPQQPQQSQPQQQSQQQQSAPGPAQPNQQQQSEPQQPDSDLDDHDEPLPDVDLEEPEGTVGEDGEESGTSKSNTTESSTTAKSKTSESKTSATKSTESKEPDEGPRNFATIAEARKANVADREFLVTDGAATVRFVRDLTKGKGADLEIQIGNSIYGTKFEEEVSLLAYEFADDATDVIQHALGLAGERNLGVSLSPNQRYVITKRVSIPKNVKYFDGHGVSIDVNTEASQDSPTSTFEFVRGASGTTIRNFTIDLGDAKFTRGIAAVAVTDITITGVTMTGLSYRGIELAADGGDLKNIRVENNRIENIVGEKETKGQVISISVNSERNDPDDRFKNSASPIWDRYVTDGTVSPNRYENSNISIVGNYIHGGYYGISFSGVSDSVIRDNEVTANTRNISMQNNCNNNVVEHNSLSNSYSSSVHIAYNSNGNEVLNNTVRTEVSHGQALLQAYQDSDRNTFRGNSVTVVGEQQPSWLLYVGTDSDDNVFVNNTIDGAARRAVVGIESIWDGRSAESNLNGAPTNLHSYMSNGTIESPVDKSKVTYGGGRGPLRKVTVEDNVFTPRNANTPLVYVGAEVTGGQVGNERIVGDIHGVSLANNTIVGNGCSELLKTHTGGLPEIGEAKIMFQNDSVGEHKTN